MWKEVSRSDFDYREMDVSIWRAERRGYMVLQDVRQNWWDAVDGETRDKTCKPMLKTMSTLR